MQIEFSESERSTLGIEWELALVDSVTGDLVHIADEVLHDLRDARRRGASADHGRAAAQHRRARHRRAPHGAGCRRRPPGADRPTCGRHRPARRRTDVRGHASVRAVVRPEGHPEGALRQADRPHPVVGPQDDDLGHPRARRHRRPRQGAADRQRTADLLPAPAGAQRVEPVLGRREHRATPRTGRSCSSSCRPPGLP